LSRARDPNPALALNPRFTVTALNQVSAAVERHRLAAYDSLRAELPFQKIRRLARHLQSAAERSESANGLSKQGTLRPGRAWAAAARATRRAAAVRSAIEAAGTVYIPESLHDVRIVVKKLRYALEIGAEAPSQRGSRNLPVLKAAQHLLGRLHDLEILIGRVRHEQASLSPPTLTAWRELDSLVNALEEDCRVLHAGYLRDCAKLIAIADRVGRKRHVVVVNRRAAGEKRFQDRPPAARV
jgi:CHAD domain-containing protein